MSEGTARINDVRHVTIAFEFRWNEKRGVEASDPSRPSTKIGIDRRPPRRDNGRQPFTMVTVVTRAPIERRMPMTRPRAGFDLLTAMRLGEVVIRLTGDERVADRRHRFRASEP